MMIVQLFEARDTPAVAALFDRCADDFLFEDGEPATSDDARDLFRDVPEGWSDRSLRVFGHRHGDRLIAAGALLPSYPETGCWYLPCMMVDPARRGLGVGRAFHDALRRNAAADGAQSMRLAALEQNEPAIRFWHALGYRQIRRVGPDRFKRRMHHRLEMALSLTSCAGAHCP